MKCPRHSENAWWPEDFLAGVESALRNASGGRPTVVMVEGEPGMGKTTLLREFEDRAPHFRMMAAEGVDRAATPFAVLEQWGVSTAAGTTPFVAAQLLRERIDAIHGDGPVLMVLDDVQWADPESVEALTWLVRRAVADPLLIVAGSRPLAPDQHPLWQRLVRTSANVTRMRLAGLSEELATAMIRQHHPSLPDHACHQLWAHCEGNPLYLSALLSELDPVEVLQMRVLPAPSQFEQLTNARLSELRADEVQVVRAVAVLGNDWVTLPVLAATVDLPDVVDAVSEGERVGLLQVRTLDGAPCVRPSHALVRSAVYHSTPLRQRRALHLRAADVVVGPEQHFGHRVQAATSFDDGLAVELRTQAERLHLERSYRMAARLLSWSAQVTSDRRLRERLWLDALFERLLAGELDGVRRELTAVTVAGNQGRIQLLLGLMALRAIRPNEAMRRLGRAVELLDLDGDPRSCARAWVLLAAAHLRLGSSAETLADDLARARETDATDPALAYFEVFTDAVISLRRSSTAELLAGLSFLAGNAPEVPVSQNSALASRGHLRVYEGLVPEALHDLREVYDRAVGGDAVAEVSEVADGLLLSAIAGGHWLHGEWELARVSFSLVEELAPNMAVLPRIWQVVLPAAVGDVVTADRRLIQAAEALEREPYPEVVDMLLFARVTYLHALGHDDEKQTLLAEFRNQWPSSLTGYPASVWYCAAAQAAIWGQDVELADRWIAKLEDADALARWAPAAAHWLRGLEASMLGRPAQALDLLRTAVRMPCVDIPFYRAHMLRDHADHAHTHGLHVEAEASREDATRIYRRLGATPYLASQRTQPAAAMSPEGVAAPDLRSRFNLTEREDAVATLVADGMSYAQVARHLFISRSTVGFHLGNVYAKAGVNSRGELHDLARSIGRSTR